MDLIQRLRTKPPTCEDAVAAADKIEQLQLALGAIISSYDHAWEVGNAVVRCRKIMADGQKPWDEIERLNKKIKEQTDEIERLREALKRIADYEGGPVDLIWEGMAEIARSALQQKESE